MPRVIFSTRRRARLSSQKSPFILAVFMAALVSLALATAPVSAAPDSKGTDFWLAFPSNLGGPELTLFIAGDTTTSGTVNNAPRRRARDRGVDTVRGAPATSCAVEPTTRAGARKGTAANSLAERSAQRSAPSVMTASPSSIASASRVKNGNGSVVVSAKPMARTVAHVHRIRSGRSTRPTAE